MADRRRGSNHGRKNGDFTITPVRYKLLKYMWAAKKPVRKSQMSEAAGVAWSAMDRTVDGLCLLGFIKELPNKTYVCNEKMIGKTELGKCYTHLQSFPKVRATYPPNQANADEIFEAVVASTKPMVTVPVNQDCIDTVKRLYASYGKAAILEVIANIEKYSI